MFVLDQICPSHMDIDVSRNREAHHGTAEIGRTQDEIGWNRAIAKNFLVAVEISE